MRWKRLVHLLGIVGVCVVLLYAVDPALAQGQGPTEDEVNAIAKQLYCPVCENVPLDVCPTQACTQWRGIIREKLAQGWGEDQIKQYFVDQYGDRVLAAPPPGGLNWLVYVVPPVAILLSAFVLFRVFRSWRQPPGQEVPSVMAEKDNPYVSRLEEELRRRA